MDGLYRIVLTNAELSFPHWQMIFLYSVFAAV